MLRKGMFLADRYEIIEQIGTGGMSDVYKALCHKLNRYVAIKVMKSEFSEDKTFVSKFRAEAQSVAGLTHSNIVNVYDVGDENGIYYIVMELVEGITLKKYIEKRGKIPFKEAVSIAIQVANGMDAAHKHHVVHRDIKPQNIIISKEGKVKVTDFGIAKAASSSTINSSSTMGSVHYISPEQARGGYSDSRSDIYSLGITIYEMLTGTVPFDGDSSVAVAVQHIQDEIPMPAAISTDIPLSINNIVLKCTQKKPDRRYQTAADLIVDLKKSLVMPDADFVEMVPAYGAGASMASSDSSKDEKTFASSKQSASNNSYDDMNEEDLFGTFSDEESDVDSDNDNDYEYDDSYGDDDSNGYEEEQNQTDNDTDIDDEPNDKIDLIMKIIGVGIAVVIMLLTIFIVVKLVGSTKQKKPSSSSESTETVSSVEDTEKDDSNKVKVPNVVGMTKEEAIKELNAVGLGYKAVIQSSKTVAKDKVISQGTTAGSKVEKNTQIILTISGGEETVNKTVPTVTGLTEEEAKKILETEKFQVSVDYQYSSTVDEGKVIKFSPSGNVAEGSTITITVSRGKEVAYVKMPKVIGLTASEARQKIEAAGLVAGQQYGGTSSSGKVVGAEYDEGTTLAAGTSVYITVEKETTTKAPTETTTKASETTTKASETTTQSSTQATTQATSR